MNQKNKGGFSKKLPILNSTKKEEPNFLGKKYLIRIFYIDQKISAH
jgi:hypothetical protein